MSKTFDSKMAFPYSDKYRSGMSLRDYFAAHAPDVPPWWKSCPLDDVLNAAEWKYTFADAMLRAREKKYKDNFG